MTEEQYFHVLFVNALQLGSMQLLSVSMKATYATFEMKAILKAVLSCGTV